jgi:hypothetical protein
MATRGLSRDLRWVDQAGRNRVAIMTREGQHEAPYRRYRSERPAHRASHVVGVHNHVAQISTVNPRAAVGFMGPYHIRNDGTNWWEIKTASNLCLAWKPSDPNSYVYAESCQPGDLEEYWANHTGLQFENAGGNIIFGEDAWLWWFSSDCNPAGNTCNLSVIPDRTQPLR